MVIMIYGKEGCGKCESAKEKMVRLGLDYGYAHIEEHAGWRDDGTVEAMVHYTLEEDLPVISIDGDYMTYPVAMRALKAQRLRREEAQ